MMTTCLFTRWTAAWQSTLGFLLAVPVCFASSELPQSQLLFGFDAASYLYSERPQKDSFFPSLNFRWKGRRDDSPGWQAVGNAVAQLVFQPAKSNFYIEVPEAYMGTKLQNPAFRVSVGRKLQSWNHLDRYWMLGIWEPRFRWDYIRPERVGLTGGMLEYQNDRIQVLAFASPLFVPERGVSVEFRNGSVSSASPWFISPPSRISIVETPTPVAYSIEEPEVSDVLFRPSAGIHARIGKGYGFWSTFGYANQPINQIVLAYDGFLQHEAVSKPVAQATIHPRILRHHLGSLETGYESRSWGMWISSLYDAPMRDSNPARWTTQELSPALSVSPTLEWRPGEPFAGAGSALSVSYLRVWGGNAPDQGAFASGGGSVFDSRYPFGQALSLGASLTLPRWAGAWSRGLKGAARWIRDISHAGSILSTEIEYGIGEKAEAGGWRLALGVDILGSNASESEAESAVADGDFIGRYRSNDRIHAGVSYVF